MQQDAAKFESVIRQFSVYSKAVPVVKTCLPVTIAPNYFLLEAQ